VATRPDDTTPRRLILRSFQSPGDVVMLTAAVRDLHAAHPGRFLTDVRTSAEALWEHNPHLTRLRDAEPGVTTLDMQYPLIHHSNQRPYHFIHGYVQYLEERLGLRIPLTRFHGDIYLSAAERAAPSPCAELGVPERFWIVVAGGKYDFTAKWWDPARYQAVVDHFLGRIAFVQCGEQGHWHPRLSGVIDLIGRTSTRDFVRLMYHADGVLCGVTFAMHLAAAVVTKPGRARQRACVVVAGGREPPHWEAYPQHQFLSTVGALPCCAEGGCWKSRCQLVGDGDDKDRRDVCELPVQMTPALRIPKCMHLITPQDVIRAIDLYYRGGALLHVDAAIVPPADRVSNASGRQQALEVRPTAGAPSPLAKPGPPESPMHVLIKFRHGLGDAVQLTAVLNHLRHYHPDWRVEVGALVGKHSAFHGLCHRAFAIDREHPNLARYGQVFELAWDECHTCYADWPATKAERCLLEVFRLRPIAERCRYAIQRGEGTQALARRYLESICKTGPGPSGRFPAVLIHYEGNTSRERKDIPVDVVRRLCDDILEAGAVPVILDWDRRSPLPDDSRIYNPNVHAELWGGTGTGDAEALAALIELSVLMVGVDSGPLHVAGATTTPTIGVWLGHHPLHFFGLADNVMHLVPQQHAGLLRGDRATGEAFFRNHYRHQTYRDLEPALRALVRERLGSGHDGLVWLRDYWVRADNAEQDLVVVRDIAEEDSYRVEEVPMPRPVVVDVGAHIGCFSKRLHQRNPLARIVAVECCPENVAALSKNVGAFATVVQAAVTYEREVALLNAVYPGCISTGGSTVIGRDELRLQVEAGSVAARPGREMPSEYWADFRPVVAVTLEQLMERYRLERIDFLKLDCEGSEFSILRHTPSLDRIGLIMGEYHGKQAFMDLVRERFAGWELRVIRDGELGTFWLTNPRADGPVRGWLPR
jgi:FkbM family methyltransferase